MERINILGVGIDNLTLFEALKKIEALLEEGGQHYIVTCNPEFLMAAQKDEEFKRILNQAALALADGMGIKLAASYLKIPLKARITGVDLTWQIAKIAALKDKSIYLIGARGNVAKLAAEKLRKKFPSLKIVGAEPGLKKYDRDESEENKELIKRINQARPEIIFVAFGAPRQEKWISHNLTKIPSVKLAMGVGGTFDFIAGTVRRAPRLLRFIGLEWFWRLLIQPWRLARIYTAVVRFSWRVLRSKDR